MDRADRARGAGTAAVVPVLLRARAILAQADQATTPADRFVLGHLAALRGAAAVVAWATPPTQARRRGAPRTAWGQLVEAAPELTGWADAFAAQSERRAQVEAGIGAVVDPGDAHRVLLQAEAFLAECAAVVGILDPGLGPGLESASRVAS